VTTTHAPPTLNNKDRDRATLKQRERANNTNALTVREIQQNKTKYKKKNIYTKSANIKLLI